jgi:hypothetical protein
MSHFLTGWQLAVYEALCALTGPEHEVVGRNELVRPDVLASIMARAGSGAKDPEQAVSLALQRLRDKGFVEFVGPGRYRVCEPAAAASQLSFAGLA